MVCNTCVAGTYSLGGVNSCITCPDGYTSDSEAKTETECYIETTPGKYIAVANDSNQIDCPEGSYCPSTKVYYGSTGMIESCGENMTSDVGSTSENDCHSMYVTCPDGYTSDGNVTDISECYVQTTAGKYIKNANDSTETDCPSGSYCPSTKVYYGSTGGIETCPSYYNKSPAKSGAITKCYVTTTSGKWIATAYATSQTTCPAGYYCTSTNVNYGSTGGRTSCPGSYTSDSGATGDSSCYIKTSGGEYIATARSSTKTTCPTDSYCPAATIYYGSTGNIQSCGTNKRSPAGSSSSSDCYGDGYTYTKSSSTGFVGKYICVQGTAHITSCSYNGTYGSGTCNMPPEDSTFMCTCTYSRGYSIMNYCSPNIGNNELVYCGRLPSSESC